MDSDSKKRNIYIDVMKGLLITLVVIGHLQYFEYDSRTLVLIYSFHMHAFLIIGGILSHIDENSKLSKILLKRIKGTLIPYFVFYLISFIIVPTFSNEQRLNALKVVIYGIGIPPDDALNLPLWFLTFYFVVMTLFEIIQIISHRIAKLFVRTNNTVGANFRSPRTGELREPSTRTGELHEPSTRTGELRELLLAMLITLIFISIIMRASFVYARIYKLKRLPYNIEIAGFCLGFVFFGNVLGKITQIKNANSNSTRTINIKSTIIKIAIIIISIFALALIAKTWYEYSMWNGRIDLNARDYKNAFYMYVDAILGFILFAIFSYVVSLIPFIKKLFSYLGKNSLYILAYHVPSVFYTGAYLIPFFPASLRDILSRNSLISIFIMTSLGIAFSLLCSLFHKAVKYFFSNVNS